MAKTMFFLTVTHKGLHQEIPYPHLAVDPTVQMRAFETKQTDRCVEY